MSAALRFERLDPIAADIAGPCAYCDDQATLLLVGEYDDDLTNTYIEWLCDSERCAAEALIEEAGR